MLLFVLGVKSEICRIYLVDSNRIFQDLQALLGDGPFFSFILIISVIGNENSGVSVAHDQGNSAIGFKIKYLL